MTAAVAEDLVLPDLTITSAGRTFVAQAFFIDLDGTMLDSYRKRIGRKNRAAVRTLNQHRPVVISTGRAYSPKIQTLMQTLGIQYAICQNGALIVDEHGTTLANIALRSEQITQVLEAARQFNLAISINGTFEVFSDIKSWCWLRWFWSTKFKRTSAINWAAYPTINKLTLVGRRRKKIHAAYTALKPQISGVSIKTSGHDYVIEITHEAATKGQGARFISARLGVAPHQSVHIGDSQNDATTAGIVGALIAMKNASRKLLAVATHVGPHYRRGGLARLLAGNFREIKR